MASTMRRRTGQRWAWWVGACLSLASGAWATGSVRIEEFLASNRGGLHDADGDAPDWIELHNPGSDPVGLPGWALTDNPNDRLKWRFPATNLAGGAYLVVFASGKNRAVPGGELHTNFKLDAAGDYLALNDPAGNLVQEFAPVFRPQVANVSYGLASVSAPVVLLASNAPVRLLVPAGPALGTNWIGRGFDDWGWIGGANGVGYERTPGDPLNYTGCIRTDVGRQMYGSNASCYLRYAIVLPSASSHTRYRLWLSYDDGFVAWLNGVEIARRNAPDPVLWNSLAVAQQADDRALVAEEFNLAAFEGLWVAGTNVLAIQGLNAGKTSPDFLILPVIEATPTAPPPLAWRYFPGPTPGAPNGSGVSVLGPILRNVGHAPGVPREGDAVAVSVRVTAALDSVAAVTLEYRAMFGPSTTLPMWDDGRHGDGVAGDGLYGATIPAHTATAGQMVRYRVRATDTAGRASSMPLGLDPWASSLDLGYAVADPSVTSALPVLEWFVAERAAADTETGTRCSLVFGDEFFDNVFVRIRGGTARSWPKKSYKFELNEDHHLRLHPGLGRKNEFELNATYTDKSYVRARLAAEVSLAAGVPAPETFHVQVRQNSRFFSLALFVEQVDEDFLRRHGLDPLGALYKAGPGSTYDAAGSFEKKTRRDEGRADLDALIASLSLTGATLERFIFDQLDLPALVNYLATVALTQNIDAADKNQYLYRDTRGTGEWRLFPWDLDLTFGPDYLNTDTIVAGLCDVGAPHCPSHPFVGTRPYLLHAGKWNRLHEALVKTPRTRAMLLRRIRSLVDQFLAAGYCEGRLEVWRATLEGEVERDHAAWGAQAHFPGASYSLGQALGRIRTEYLVPRLAYLTGTAIPGIGAAMPGSQPAAAAVRIGAVESLPASERPGEQFVRLDNPGVVAVDVSGWRLEGDAGCWLRPGTVIPAGDSLYVCRATVEFRRRSEPPRGGQGRYVQGVLDGALPAWSGRLVLRNPTGEAVSSVEYRADSDQDGTPDAWERIQGLDPAVNDADRDPDGDGLSNRAEFVAGTAARDPASVLRLAASPAPDGAVVLGFEAQPGRSYRVLAADNAAGESWTLLTETGPVAMAGQRTVTDRPPVGANRYYRVECRRRGLGGD